MPAQGFDNEKYLAEQTAAILERVEHCRGKLYLEFGGKLTFDFHAARVLPGYDPNVKLRLLQGLRDQIEWCSRPPRTSERDASVATSA